MSNWEDIVDEHGPLVWRTAYRLLGNEADAADCYQEAFVAALTVSKKDIVKNWAGLLRKLTTVHALDRLRRRFKDAGRMGPHIDLDMVATADRNPSEVAEDHELIEWLRGALVELPEMQARAFCLICLDGFSYQEAAIQLGMDAGNVGVLLHRARSQLRNLIALVPDSRKG